jgi:hypothetical protein
MALAAAGLLIASGANAGEDFGTLKFSAADEQWTKRDALGTLTETQTITVSGCSYSSDTNLADVTGSPALNGQKDKLGRVDGRQCGEISDGDSLSIALGTSFGPSIAADGASIQTVLKGNAEVTADVYDVTDSLVGSYTLTSGSSVDCKGNGKNATPRNQPGQNETYAFPCVSDSNPDDDKLFIWAFPVAAASDVSGPHDPAEWTSITFTVTSGDFAIKSADISLVTLFEGDLDCGETDVEGVIGSEDTNFAVTRLPDAGTLICNPIPYSTIVRNDEEIDVLKLNLGQTVALLIEIDWTEELATAGSLASIPLSLQDFQGTLNVPIDLCVGDPEYGSQAALTYMVGDFQDFQIGESITNVGNTTSATLLGFVNNGDDTGSILYKLTPGSDFGDGDQVIGVTSAATAFLNGAPLSAFLRLNFAGSPPPDQDPSTAEFDYGCLLERDLEYQGIDSVTGKGIVDLRELIYLEGDWTAKRR